MRTINITYDLCHARFINSLPVIKQRINSLCSIDPRLLHVLNT